MALSSTLRIFSATGDDAPQSSKIVVPSAWTRKQVLKRPPDPNASPEPMTVSRMRSGFCARPRRDLGMPAFNAGHFVGQRQLGRLHEIHRDHRGDVGNAVAVAGNVAMIF